MANKKNFEIAFELGAKMNSSVRTAFGKANKQVGGLRQNLKKAAKTAGKFALGFAGAATAAAGASVAMANKFAKTGDRIDKMSQKLGLSRQGFQEWDFVISQFGGNIDSLQQGMKTLAMRADEANQGVGIGSEVFDRLGVSVRDANGEMKSQEALFNEVVTALQGVESEVEKAALANDILGRSGQDLLPLLNSDSEAIEKLKKEAHDLGMVIGDEAVDAAVLWTDTMDKGKRALGGIFNTVASKALPIFQKFLDRGINNLPKLQQNITNAMDRAGQIIGWIGETGLRVFNSLRDAIKENFPQVSSLRGRLSDLGGVLQSAFQNARPYMDWFINRGIPIGIQVLAGIYNRAMSFYRMIKDNWSIIKPVLIGVAIALTSVKVGMMAVVASMKAMAIVKKVTAFMKAFRAATVAARLSMLGLNGALLANPITWVVAGIAALVAAVILIWRNFDTVKEKALQLWRIIKDNPFLALVAGPIGALIAAGITLYKNWDVIKEKAVGLWNKLKNIFGNIGDFISTTWENVAGSAKGGLNAIISAINKMIGGINNISIDVPAWVGKIPGVPDGISSFGFNIPEIPMLAKGGIAARPTLAMIGEGGEQEAVLPLSKLENLINMPASNTTNVNSSQPLTIDYNPQVVIHGNADEATVHRALSQDYNQFKKLMDRYISERKRVSFSE